MKILVLTNLYPPAYIGGYELICQTVVEGLRQRGHQIEILTSDHQRRRACPSEVEPPVDRSLRIHGLYGHPWRGVLRLSSIERHNNARLRDTLMQSKPDLVYVWNMGGLSKSMLFTLQQTGIPTVFYVSDHWISRSLAQDVWLRWWQATDRDPARKLLRLAMHISGLQRAWLRRAPAPPVSYLAFRRIYFCSRALRALTASAGYAVGHGAVIPPPIHPRYLQSAPVPPPAQLERLLYVGRLTQDKGVLTALRAVARLRGQMPVRLSIYGSGESDYMRQLHQFAHEQQLEVSFAAAPLETMPDIYRQHDLLLFPSEWEEPFALTPLEAMAIGLPVIGTTTGGSAELFRHGSNGLTYRAGDSDALADCILTFGRDEVLRRRCATVGCAEARQRYAAPVIVQAIEDYLQETVSHWSSFLPPESCAASPQTTLCAC